MNPTEFDISNGAIYVAILSAPIVGITWIESTHSLGAGLMAGLFGTVILLVVRVWVRRSMR